MDVSASEEECIVCMDKIHNPSQPFACCGKVICQNCLRQSLRFRPHCPHCRSPQNGHGFANNSVRPPRSRRNALRIMPEDFETFNSRRSVSSNIQILLSQLQNSQQMNTVNPLNPLNQTPPPPAPLNLAPPPFIRRPVPTLRRQQANLFTIPQPASINATPSGFIQITPTPVTAPDQAPVQAPVQNPFQARVPALTPAPVLTPDLAPFILNPAPIQDDLEAELEQWSWQTDLALMEMNQQSQGFSLRTFVCPYCQEGGLDELGLRDHCNNNHAYDSRRVVCPVCVATPHGDPRYYSRGFISHLNLRHCYYLGDFTNLQQSDEVNIQCAVLASYNTNI